MISRATDFAIARGGQLHSLFCATTSFMGPSLCTATRLAHRPDPFMYPEWAALVFPRGPWDIKTDYPDTASMSVRVGNVEVPVEGDKLGNIHYGYIGTAVGFNDFELTWLDKTDWIPTGDPEDMPAIRLGASCGRRRGRR